MRRASRAWKQRDPKLQELFAPKAPLGSEEHPHHGFNHDLDPNATCILLPDTIDTKRDCGDSKPFQLLKSNLLHHLSSGIPSLAIHTGNTKKLPLKNPAPLSLSTAASRVLGNTNVLALDLRVREQLTPTEDSAVSNASHRLSSRKRSRAGLIAAGKQQIEAACENYLAQGLADNYDVCMLAFMHDLLMGDGDPYSSEQNEAVRHTALMTLHEAINRAREDNAFMVDDGDLPRATQEQISEAAQWLTNRVFNDAWRVTHDVAEREVTRLSSI